MTLACSQAECRISAPQNINCTALNKFIPSVITGLPLYSAFNHKSLRELHIELQFIDKVENKTIRFSKSVTKINIYSGKSVSKMKPLWLFVCEYAMQSSKHKCGRLLCYCMYVCMYPIYSSIYFSVGLFLCFLFMYITHWSTDYALYMSDITSKTRIVAMFSSTGLQTIIHSYVLKCLCSAFVPYFTGLFWVVH